MALYHDGLSKPPRDQRHRRWWAVAILLFCALLAPFTVLGAVRGWLAGDVLDALGLTTLSVLCLGGVASAVWALVDSFRGSGPHRGAAGAQPSR
ncbi:hypothetical protein JN535_16290 [Cellulosimicrobium cellulans]|uniref:hypothetical protein n=1 Tax=Cellulosimicrobium cellulans TaxID=1710 RepID=UPI001965A013|nr:hypothetical protein [Cellulosimicrobium cellulans]MBN0041722.1 hypothetical protein [Cellulosimicrobium cellulans]